MKTKTSEIDRFSFITNIVASEKNDIFQFSPTRTKYSLDGSGGYDCLDV
jgi:hypothetical protein